MHKQKILIQFDPDSHASTFDSVVAIDAGVNHLLCQPGVAPEDIEPLVHGAMFTRGVEDLHNTALFFGGSNVGKTEALVNAAKDSFFGPMRVSLLSDPNGCNTTAAAAVICAEKHLDLSGKTVTILAGTGPVGMRIAQIIAGPATNDSEAPTIRICSRSLEKTRLICEAMASTTQATLIPIQANSGDESLAAVAGSDVVFSAGAAGIELLPADWQHREAGPLVAIDLNAVPPAGISGIQVMDKGGKQLGETVCYGAIGVGGLKMKIHKRALQMLFERNDHLLEIEQVYQVGQSLRD